MRFLPDTSFDAAQVAYALPRRVGSAVMRNKIRRRLREIVRDLDRETPNGLPAGFYLIGAKQQVNGCSYSDLRSSLGSCLSKFERVA